MNEDTLFGLNKKLTLMTEERDALRAENERLKVEVELLGKYPGGWDGIFMEEYRNAQKLRADRDAYKAALEYISDCHEGETYHDTFFAMKDAARHALEAQKGKQ